MSPALPIEWLESRMLLSASATLTGSAGVTTVRSTPAISAAATRAVRTVHLLGKVAGEFSTSTAPDSGTDYRFLGSGSVRPLGSTELVGDLMTPGLVTAGHATGQLTVSSAKGSLTLAVVGPKEPGLGSLPRNLVLKVTSGTGAFASAQGTGVLALRLNSSTHAFVMRFST